MILRLTSDLHLLPLHSHREYPKLMGVFREYGEWLGILGIEDVGSLNDEAAADGLRHEVLVSEALHEKRLAELADEITGRPEVRMVLVAGPSSSGKTTFSKRLAVQLMVNGVWPFALALDDYCRPRADAATARATMTLRRSRPSIASCSSSSSWR